MNLLYLILLLGPVVNSFLVRPHVRLLCSLKSRSSCLLATSSNDVEEPKLGVVPFDSTDFQRKDIPMKSPKPEPSQLKGNAEKKLPKVEKRSMEDSDRPTGYGNLDEDDKANNDTTETDEDNWIPRRDDETVDSAAVKLFKDLYIPSPYDSRKKQQAKFVIRNITVLSFGIGIIFAAIWVLFPGQFISYKGDHVQTYQTTYTDPNFLLDEGNKGGGEMETCISMRQSLQCSLKVDFHMKTPSFKCLKD